MLMRRGPSVSSTVAIRAFHSEPHSRRKPWMRRLRTKYAMDNVCLRELFTNSEQTAVQRVGEAKDSLWCSQPLFASLRSFKASLPSPVPDLCWTEGARILSQRGVMRKTIAQIPSSVSGLRRALELWPYVFVVISITGLAYIALTAGR